MLPDEDRALSDEALFRETVHSGRREGLLATPVSAAAEERDILEGIVVADPGAFRPLVSTSGCRICSFPL